MVEARTRWSTEGGVLRWRGGGDDDDGNDEAGTSAGEEDSGRLRRGVGSALRRPLVSGLLRSAGRAWRR